MEMGRRVNCIQMLLSYVLNSNQDDYVYVDRTNGSGALFVWYNRGSADTSRAMDGLYFADMDGTDHPFII